jgi:hypothetical protein
LLHIQLLDFNALKIMAKRSSWRTLPRPKHRESINKDESRRKSFFSSFSVFFVLPRNVFQLKLNYLLLWMEGAEKKFQIQSEWRPMRCCFSQLKARKRFAKVFLFLAQTKGEEKSFSSASETILIALKEAHHLDPTWPPHGAFLSNVMFRLLPLGPPSHEFCV